MTTFFLIIFETVMLKKYCWYFLIKCQQHSRVWQPFQLVSNVTVSQWHLLWNFLDHCRCDHRGPRHAPVSDQSGHFTLCIEAIISKDHFINSLENTNGNNSYFPILFALGNMAFNISAKKAKYLQHL